MHGATITMAKPHLCREGDAAKTIILEMFACFQNSWLASTLHTNLTVFSAHLRGCSHNSSLEHHFWVTSSDRLSEIGRKRGESVMEISSLTSAGCCQLNAAFAFSARSGALERFLGWGTNHRSLSTLRHLAGSGQLGRDHCLLQRKNAKETSGGDGQLSGRGLRSSRFSCP